MSELLQNMKDFNKNLEAYNKRQPPMRFYHKGISYTIQEYLLGEFIFIKNIESNVAKISVQKAMQMARKSLENKK